MGSADALLIERVRSYLPHLPEPNPYGSLLYLPWLRSRKAVRVTITVAPVSATMASHRSVTPSRVVTRNTAFRLAERDGNILADVRPRRARQGDRKSVVEGKSVSVRVKLGGRRLIKKKKHMVNTNKHH